jgi:tRNA (mo5U34)-methyltransferase
MTHEEILAEVERLGPWFHCIELGPGIKTKTRSEAGEPIDHPKDTWQGIRRHLPDDLSGKSVLDVGCNGGFYAVQAKRRNAARVLGVDSQRHHIRQALFVRRVLGLEIEFQRMSVYDLSPGAIGQFDITLALGLIYHCKHLVMALEKLFQVTKNTLIVETAVLPPGTFPTSVTSPLGGLSSVLYPLAYVENPRDSKEAAYNWFLPTAEAAQALLQSVGFDDVSSFPMKGERAVLVCHKKEHPSGDLALHHLAAEIGLEAGETSCLAGSQISYRVRVKNTGSTRWPYLGELKGARGEVRLGAHLVGEDEEVLSWDYGRARLRHELAPGEADALDIRLQAPSQPGVYVLEFDMLAEHITWFEDLGSPILRLVLQVQ